MELPIEFTDRIKKDFGINAQQFLDSLALSPELSVRINPRKFSLTEQNDKVKWCDDAFYLKSRPVFTQDPLFHCGSYYVQEASSMFLGEVLSQLTDLPKECVALDLCAAPGGKSTHIASYLDGQGLLISNEVTNSRVASLRENMSKWGYGNVIVTSSKPSDFSPLTGLVDLLVVDAPCSGEGMFRKDDQAVTEWSQDNVIMCQKRQREILSDIYPVLKQGGYLIYSTCTYNELEDDDNVKWICDTLGAELVTIKLNSDWGITDNGSGCHFYPYRSRGEGFFIAALRKVSDDGSLRLKTVKNKQTKIDESIKKSILNADKYSFILKTDHYLAFPEQYVPILEELKKYVKVVQSGVDAFIQKGKDFLPAPALALSTNLNREAFPTVDLDWNAAMQYLKRENIVLDSNIKGWNLVSFRNVPLGWVKNLGNRVNNAYPAEWHVRMAVSEELYTPII